jgi:hypothetical protein
MSALPIPSKYGHHLFHSSNRYAFSCCVSLKFYEVEVVVKYSVDWMGWRVIIGDNEGLTYIMAFPGIEYSMDNNKEKDGTFGL